MITKKFKQIGSTFLIILLLFSPLTAVDASDSLETEVGVGFYGEWLWDDLPESQPKPIEPGSRRPQILSRLPQTGAIIVIGGSFIFIIMMLSALLLLWKKRKEEQDEDERISH